MIGAICPPRTPALAYPPYWVPAIQDVGTMMNEHELVMSDVPWAVAWYGRRQCVWLSVNSQDDFFAINDYIKPVRALYLTPLTMDSRFVTGWVRSGAASWGIFALHCMERKENAASFPPPNFPLHSVMPKIGAGTVVYHRLGTLDGRSGHEQPCPSLRAILIALATGQRTRRPPRP